MAVVLVSLAQNLRAAGSLARSAIAWVVLKSLVVRLPAVMTRLAVARGSSTSSRLECLPMRLTAVVLDILAIISRVALTR